MALLVPTESGLVQWFVLCPTEGNNGCNLLFICFQLKLAEGTQQSKGRGSAPSEVQVAGDPSQLASHA